MKYLFFDIECADGGKGTICSLGYVIADMDFKIIKREEIVMNPESNFNLEGRAGRPDVPLAYPRETFLRSPKFPKFHAKLKLLFENKDYYIIGHAVGNDVNYLNKSCRRYGLEPFEFRFFDTQRMYQQLLGVKKSPSLENALAALEVNEKFRSHQSVEDARATLLLLKALLMKANTSFEDYLASTDRCTGSTEGGKATWDYIPPESEYKRPKEDKLKGEKGDNVMLRGRRNHTIFLRYLDYGEGIGEKSDKLMGKNVTISMNYETEHFKEMMILAGMIKAAGGEYVLMASTADIFATVDVKNEDGTLRRCSRGDYVRAEIENGKNIEVITFDDLLALLGTTREELEAMPELDTEYLLDDKYKKPVTA